MNLINEIKTYILFLKNDMGLNITLHPYGSESVIMPTELSLFNIHDNSYCIFTKSCDQLHQHCIDCQKRVRQKAKEGSFVGTCHAGVKEFIYPIPDGNTNQGFVSVSGYKDECGDSYVKRVAQKYSISYEHLSEMYASLKDELPTKARLDTLMNPLIRMLELAYINAQSQPERELTFTDLMVAYIKRHHCQNITSEDICRRFSCSRSYMSGQFNQDMGMSVREYITNLRIEDAKQLLKFSNLTVTEIAMTVGYTDSNYFTNLFKQKSGITPSQYRRNQKNSLHH